MEKLPSLNNTIFSASISIVVCEDDQKCNLLLDRAPRCLTKLICVKDVRPATKQRAKNRGVEIVKFSDVEVIGAKKNHLEVVSLFTTDQKLYYN